MSGKIKHYLGDKDVNLILGTLLRVGVIVSTSIVFIGGLVFLLQHNNQAVNYKEFVPESVQFDSVAAIFGGLKHFEGLAIIQFGVLLLIFTPIARVVFSIFSFLIEKDYMYVLIGIIVLSVIITSLYLDIAHQLEAEGMAQLAIDVNKKLADSILYFSFPIFLICFLAQCPTLPYARSYFSEK